MWRRSTVEPTGKMICWEGATRGSMAHGPDVDIGRRMPLSKRVGENRRGGKRLKRSSSLFHCKDSDPVSDPMIAKQRVSDGLFGLLDEHLLVNILEKIHDATDRQSWCLACKRFLAVEASTKRNIRLLRADMLESVLRRYKEVEELDISLCSQIDNDALQMAGTLSAPNLRNLNVSRLSKFTDTGLLSLVGPCTSLVHLDLSYCSQITDRGMTAVAQLKKLETLKLVNCRNITDAGLGCVAAGCKSLRSLSLRWCLGITDTGISLVAANCRQLDTVDLSYTVVSAQGLASITVLPALKNLILVSCNSVDDVGLACLMECRNSLLNLDVARCQNVSDHGIIALAAGPVPLQQLTLSYCLPITDLLLASFEKFEALQVIKLDGCHIAGNGLAFIGKGCKSLKEFSVSKCLGVTDEGVRAVVDGCRNLLDIDLTCCRDLTDLSVESISNSCHGLLRLKMESCSLITDKGIALLGKGCPNLEEVDFTDCSINDEGLKSLASCKAFKTLKLGYCLNISDAGITHIAASCPNLREIDLYRCVGIGDSSVEAIAKNGRGLRILNLSYCTRITDSSLRSISTLRDLNQLEIRACVLVTSDGLRAVAAGCKKLVELDIKRCTAVDDLGLLAISEGCPNLRQVNLSYCRISNAGLLAIARLSCMQNMKLIHLKGVSLDGIADALFNNGRLKKVKLLSSLRMLLPGLVAQVESGGCRLRWMEKSPL